MKWTSGNRGNIEDLRGRSGSGLRAGVPLSLGGLALMLLLSWATGTNFLSILAPETDSTGTGTTGQVASSPEEERLVDFVDAVMEDVQRTWTELLSNQYERTRTVLFRDAISSACGFAESATGPFYCPTDRRVYLDLGFFDELRQRFQAPGDFAQAYVLAHEVGHHVQPLMGNEEMTRRGQSGNANALSVRIELQADCFAGVWAHAAAQPGRFMAGRIELERGDVEEGLSAAAAIGDDRLQRMTGGHVFPDRFTHGTSAQRADWFSRGLRAGRPEACDTFRGQTQ